MVRLAAATGRPTYTSAVQKAQTSRRPILPELESSTDAFSPWLSQ